MGHEYIEINNQQASSTKVNASVDVKLVNEDKASHFDFDVCLIIGVDTEGNTICIRELDDSDLGYRRCMLVGQALGLLELTFSNLNIIERKTALIAKSEMLDTRIHKELDDEQE